MLLHCNTWLLYFELWYAVLSEQGMNAFSMFFHRTFQNFVKIQAYTSTWALLPPAERQKNIRGLNHCFWRVWNKEEKREMDSILDNVVVKKRAMQIIRGKLTSTFFLPNMKTYKSCWDRPIQKLWYQMGTVVKSKSKVFNTLRFEAISVIFDQMIHIKFVRMIL